MLGWFISITNPAVTPQDGHHVIATWEADISGLDWIGALVKEGRATLVRRDVYPNEYSIPARELLPLLSKVLEGSQEDWIDQIRYFPERLLELAPEAVLCVTAFDLS